MKLSKEEFEKMYREMENKALCEKLGISNTTLQNYLKRFEIKRKGKGNRNNKSLVKIELT